MTAANTPAALAKGTVLVNRRGRRLFVKAAGARSVTLAEKDHSGFVGDRVPRSFVDRRIASGYWTILAA